MAYQSTKTYGNEKGLSCCFRQWRSTHSHCSLLHGYSIGVRVVFESESLDSRNWVMDFGGLKAFESWLKYMFDHTLLIAKDDPHLDIFEDMAAYGTNEDGGMCDLRIVDAVGCEKFSELAFRTLEEMLEKYKTGEEWSFTDSKGHHHSFKARYPLNSGVSVVSVEVFEHGANSALFTR